MKLRLLNTPAIKRNLNHIAVSVVCWDKRVDTHFPLSFAISLRNACVYAAKFPAHTEIPSSSRIGVKSHHKHFLSMRTHLVTELSLSSGQQLDVRTSSPRYSLQQLNM